MPVVSSLRKLRINNGGYTDKGHYYGVGAPLYVYVFSGDDTEHTLRASNREDAKAKIRTIYQHLGNVRFTR